MANPSLSDDDLRATLAAMRAHGDSQNAASAALGIARSTLQSRLRRAQQAALSETVEFPTFVSEGDEDEPIEDLLGRLRKAHERKQKAEEARRWFPIKVKEDKPYGILWFGDPHLGNGNFPLLESHLAIARRPGIYGGNIGDTTDNFPWTGKLARLWAETEMSSKSERRLAEWFMFGAGVSWLVWLLGNHDVWNAGDDFYKRLGAYRVPVIDWRAQFTLCHKNGSQTRIDAAHGRKGSSIYNPTHGTLRDAKFGEDADLYVSGHVHSFGLFDIEFPERKTHTWLAQISGYKQIDLHAKTHGFAPANRGAAMLSIINPETGGVQCFADVDLGADYLSFLRR